MIFRRRTILITGAVILLCILTFSLLHILPLNIFSIQQKPDPSPQKIYDYYLIVDEIDGRNLMYVPLVVNVGDEILTEDNKLYKVVKVEQNRASARFVEDFNLEKYKQNKN